MSSSALLLGLPSLVSGHTARTQLFNDRQPLFKGPDELQDLRETYTLAIFAAPIDSVLQSRLILQELARGIDLHSLSHNAYHQVLMAN